MRAVTRATMRTWWGGQNQISRVGELGKESTYLDYRNGEFFEVSSSQFGPQDIQFDERSTIHSLCATHTHTQHS